MVVTVRQKSSEEKQHTDQNLGQVLQINNAAVISFIVKKKKNDKYFHLPIAFGSYRVKECWCRVQERWIRGRPLRAPLRLKQEMRNTGFENESGTIWTYRST